jgi:Ca2+/Na+ antiporter
MRRKKKMKNKSIQKYLVYSIIGFTILAGGAILAKLTRDTQGIMQTLPYILIGIGAGVFGSNLGTVVNVYAMKKDPKLSKQKEIDEKDERNIEIRNKAKAKAYDLMVMAFGALMMAFALMEVNLEIVIAIVMVYLFVVLSNIYFINKYSKEM